MVTQRIRLYDSPHQFEPLMPSEAAMRPLLEHANDMMLAAKALGSSGLPGAHREIRALLRSMNSYYSNRLEGEHTPALAYQLAHAAGVVADVRPHVQGGVARTQPFTHAVPLRLG